MDEKQYRNYCSILKTELIPALGCTEPIALAYAAAALRDALGCRPDSITAACSGNIIKNVQGVIVPGTNDLRGVRASVIMGLLAGKSECKLEVLSGATAAHVEEARVLLQGTYCTVELLDTDVPLHILLRGSVGDDAVVAEIRGGHTDLIRLERNGTSLLHDIPHLQPEPIDADPSLMTLESIMEFADSFALDELQPLLERQLECNLAIAEEGLTGKWGAAVGRTLLDTRGCDVRTAACAYPAAGSDARMNGCMLPVIINSGSGNQGLTVSLPLLVYTRHLNCSREKLIRALAVSNLVALYQKRYIGKLSAFCGAVCAACGAGAGIAYLHGESPAVIKRVINNTLGNISGLVCDGAKASCAAKIASSVHAAILAFDMACENREFPSGTGIVGSDAASTVANIGRIGRDGMRETDKVILNIMIGN